MKKLDKKIPFDPGYAPVVIDSLGQAAYIYYTFSAIPDVKLKRINFPHTLRKLEKIIKTTLAFYTGCLLWACYISKFKDGEIDGNSFLGEEYQEKEHTGEIDFLIDLIKNQLPKDYKYYLSKPSNLPENYLKILETYRNFLTLNKGFTNCSNTSEIILPKNIKKLSNNELDKINDAIQKAINDKNIDCLIDLFETIIKD